MTNNWNTYQKRNRNTCYNDKSYLCMFEQNRTKNMFSIFYKSNEPEKVKHFYVCYFLLKELYGKKFSTNNYKDERFSFCSVWLSTCLFASVKARNK